MPFIEQYKIEKNQPWPWKVDYEGWRAQCIKATVVCIFNNTIINFLVLCVVGHVYGWQLPWSTDLETLPEPMTLAKHLLVLIIAEDFGFHMMHRLLHCQHPWLPLYQMFHKQHHEFIQPVSIASEYAHPLEYAIGNHQTSMLGMYLLGRQCHMWTVIIWGLVRVLETHDGHSGYEFPWSIFRLLPFGADATYHNFHHTKNVGNYSSLMTVWDTLLDSNKEFYEAYQEGSRADEPTPAQAKKAGRS